MEVIILTGMSGAGKSRAANVLEDIGYYCIDNLPPELIPTFVELAARSQEISKVAVVTDIRGGNLFSGFFDCVDQLNAKGISHTILFLDCSDEALARRHKETRRRHPLATAEYQELEHLIADERKLLSPIREIADHVVDTTYLKTTQLRERIVALLGSRSKKDFSVTVMSFGFKYGLPSESDLVLDVRCLDNPFYVDELKPLTGLDKAVIDYIEGSPDSLELLRRYNDFLVFALPLYRAEGKNELIVSVGCTGGQHRSVYFAERIRSFAAAAGYDAIAVHRDISKSK